MRHLLPMLLLLSILPGCSRTMYQASFRQPRLRASLDATAPFLKAHTFDGEVYVLASWHLVEAKQQVEGIGLRYDVHRKVRTRGRMTVPYSRIALFETNRPERVTTHRQIMVMALVTGISLGMTAYCIASPAFCFW